MAYPRRWIGSRPRSSDAQSEEERLIKLIRKMMVKKHTRCRTRTKSQNRTRTFDCSRSICWYHGKLGSNTKNALHRAHLREMTPISIRSDGWCWWNPRHLFVTHSRSNAGAADLSAYPRPKVRKETSSELSTALSNGCAVRAHRHCLLSLPSDSAGILLGNSSPPM